MKDTEEDIEDFVSFFTKKGLGFVIGIEQKEGESREDYIQRCREERKSLTGSYPDKDIPDSAW